MDLMFTLKKNKVHSFCSTFFGLCINGLIWTSVCSAYFVVMPLILFTLFKGGKRFQFSFYNLIRWLNFTFFLNRILLREVFRNILYMKVSQQNFLLKQKQKQIFDYYSYMTSV